MTATLAVTMAVLLIRYQHIEWHTLAQLVLLLAAALSLAVHHRHQGQQAAEQQSPYLHDAPQPARTSHHGTSQFLVSMSQELHPLPAPAPTGAPLATDNMQRYLDMDVIREICAAMNVTGYRVLLDQLLLDESRRLYRVCALLHGGAPGELGPAAQAMQVSAARLGLTALAGVCADIGSFDEAMGPTTRQDLCNRLKSAITTTHALAVSMGLTGAPFPTLPMDNQTTTGSGSSMMPKRS